MIYLHCGWPKTGTTSLQTTLATQRERLLEAGVIYPDRWAKNGDVTHNGLTDLLTASLDDDTLLDEVKDTLAGYAGRDVLLSSESLMIAMISEELFEALLRFLEAAEELAPVTCAWTLRRADETVHSFSLQALPRIVESQTPAQFVARVRLARAFSSMRRLEDAMEGRVIYVKYDRRGGHNAALLRSFGLRQELADALAWQVEEAPPLNVGRSRKQLATALNANTISARVGGPLDRAALFAAFDRGELRFEDDGPCELAGRDLRLRLHEQALEDARDCGFTPYLDFFESERVGEYPPPSSLELESLSDEDLRRVKAFAA